MLKSSIQLGTPYGKVQLIHTTICLQSDMSKVYNYRPQGSELKVQPVIPVMPVV